MGQVLKGRTFGLGSKKAMDANGLKYLIGDPDAVLVERGVAEIRSGRPVVIGNGSETVLAAAAEAIDDKLLTALKAASGGGARLVLSPPRLRLLGYDNTEAAILPLGEKSASAIHEIVSQAGMRLNGAAPSRASELDKA